MVNLSMTSAAELRSHRIAIAACFAFRQEINSSALWDFFDSIDPKLTRAAQFCCDAQDAFFNDVVGCRPRR
jgi:hypothetical protein